MEQNSFTEEWDIFEPISNLGHTYSIDSIEDDFNMLKIVMSGYGSNVGKTISVIFDSLIAAHRLTDESYRLKLMRELNQKYSRKIYLEGPFFKVSNSEYMRWLSEQSFGIIDELSYKHFVIVSDNYFLDIIARKDPIVCLLSTKNCL